MPQMEALKAFRFAGRNVQPGEQITATASEERTLRAMGWAKSKPSYTTRDQVAQPANDNELSGRSKPRTRRQYRRRDMQPPEA